MMVLADLVAIALAVPPAAMPVDPPAPPHNFLKGAESRRCGTQAADGEIVVCGAANLSEQYRLRPLPAAEAYRDKPVRAEANVLGDGTLSLHNEDNSVGGFQSNRAMVTLSVPF